MGAAEQYNNSTTGRVVNESVKRSADMLPPPQKRIKFSKSPPVVDSKEKAERERLATEMEEQREKLEMEKLRLEAEMEKMKVEKSETEAEQRRSLEEMERREAENQENMRRKEEENLLHQQQILQLIQTEKDRYIYYLYSNTRVYTSAKVFSELRNLREK